MSPFTRGADAVSVWRRHGTRLTQERGLKIKRQSGKAILVAPVSLLSSGSFRSVTFEEFFLFPVDEGSSKEKSSATAYHISL